MEAKAKVDDRDVYHSAELLIDQHGAEAPVQAAMRPTP
jgi:hypothetical protein